MALDPQARSLLDLLAAAGRPPMSAQTPTEAREGFAALALLAGPADEPVPTEDRSVPGPGGPIPVRVYRPAAEGPLPVVVYFHGGGFVIGDLDTHDASCHRLAAGVPAVVVSVDYRLAPEHPFPAAVEDCDAATRWVSAHAAELGADPGRLAVAGDSAGGNLAAVTAVMARDRHGPAIAAQLLLYPVIAADFDTESYRACASGFYNSREAMVWYWDQYVPDTTDRTHPYASPARADLTGLPAAVVITAGYDPPRSEGDQYAESLAAAGVPTVHRCYEGAIHGFMTMPNLALGARARDETWRELGALLARVSSD